MARATMTPLPRTHPLHPTSVPLAEKGLDNFLIICICGGGILLLLFVALLIVFIFKRKKQHRRTNGKLPLLSPRRSGQNPRGNNSWGRPLSLTGKQWRQAVSEWQGCNGGYRLFHFVVSLISEKQILCGDTVGA